MSEQEKSPEKEDVKRKNGEQPEKGPAENSVSVSDSGKEEEITGETLKKEPVPVAEKAAKLAPETTSEESPEAEIQEMAAPAAKTALPEEETKEGSFGDSEKEETGTSGEAEEEEEITSSDEEEHEEKEEVADGKSYDAMNKKQLIEALRELLNSKPIPEIKKEVEGIKNEFNSQFEEELAEKKEEYLAQGGNIIDFHYTSALKSEFNSLYFDYKEKRNAHYKKLKQDLQANLNKRLGLIEELKELINLEENINTTYKHFKDIQERWKEAGPIPRDGYNTVWNTYHHHVENFYDFLHLNREFRDLDFKHNLDQKLKIISRAEELAQEEDLNRAFRELQMLHRMWKEEIGPVAKEHREDVWERFSAATKIIHDRRAEFQKELEKEYEQNLEKKIGIISEITALTDSAKESHQAWQQNMKALEKLRTAFFETGKVPLSRNEEIWSLYKKAVRQFNQKKNKYYKEQKKMQYENLAKKQELIRIAEENKDSEDFETVTPLMKKIQGEWKAIGHVPRKDSEKIWKQFKAACNYYFDRLHKEKNEASKEEAEALEKKTALLEELRQIELSGEHKKDLATIKSKISAWKEVGRVPFNKKNIEGKFNKAIDALFKKLDMSKKEVELIRYDNKLNAITSHDDERKIQNERYFISKKIEEAKQELNQLENNLGFFQHVNDDNPLVREVHKNIQRHKDELELWKEKLKKLKEVM